MRIVAAMSGGVDSSVVAGLLVEQGHEVIGVHMKLHDAPPRGAAEADAKRCCGLDDALDARAVADKLGIPFYVMDLREAFQKAVIDDYTENWVRGGTPNPCVQCNGVLKFRVMLGRARALGAEALAPGHSARLSPAGALLQAVDADKDQTDFRFPMTEAARRATRFPLGGMTKAEVRQHARRMGLITAEKPESQETCFIPDDDHARFVSAQRPDLDGAGTIVNEAREVLGHHDGYWRFTVGQRRGLGVATGSPVYVLSVDPTRREVVVGPPERLLHQALLARGFAWHRPVSPGEPLEARIRHRGGRVPIAEHWSNGDELKPGLWLRFTAPARAAARGQAVVVYSGDEVVGGGWIREVRDATEQ